MEQLVVLLVVLSAVTFLARRLIVSWRAARGAGCASDCGCASAAGPTPAEWDGPARR
jgi:hypothetical protein